MVRNLPANAGDAGSIPGWGRSLGQEMAPLVFLPEKSHRQGSLASYSSWGPNKLKD